MCKLKLAEMYVGTCSPVCDWCMRVTKWNGRWDERVPGSVTFEAGAPKTSWWKGPNIKAWWSFSNFWDSSSCIDVTKAIFTLPWKTAFACTSSIIVFIVCLKVPAPMSAACGALCWTHHDTETKLKKYQTSDSATRFVTSLYSDLTTVRSALLFVCL